MKKKVKDLTIEELEQYYTNKTGYIPDHIDIYWYDVRFMKFNGRTNKDEVEFYLRKDQEIEVEE